MSKEGIGGKLGKLRRPASEKKNDPERILKDCDKYPYTSQINTLLKNNTTKWGGEMVQGQRKKLDAPGEMG